MTLTLHALHVWYPVHQWRRATTLFWLCHCCSYWLLILLTAKYLSSRYEVMASVAVPPCCSWDMLHTMGTHTRSPLLLGSSQLCGKEEICTWPTQQWYRPEDACINMMCEIATFVAKGLYGVCCMMKTTFSHSVVGLRNSVLQYKCDCSYTDLLSHQSDILSLHIFSITFRGSGISDGSWPRCQQGEAIGVREGHVAQNPATSWLALYSISKWSVNIQ